MVYKIFWDKAKKKYPVAIRYHNGRTVEHEPVEVDVNKYKRRNYFKALIEGHREYVNNLEG